MKYGLKKTLIASVAVVALTAQAFAALQFSVRVRNARLDAIETTIGTSAHIQIWGGTKPTDCATTAVGQTKLADFALASDWASAASAGAKSFSGTPLTTTGLAAGTASFFRLTDSTNPSTSCDEHGSVPA